MLTTERGSKPATQRWKRTASNEILTPRRVHLSEFNWPTSRPPVFPKSRQFQFSRRSWPLRISTQISSANLIRQENNRNKFQVQYELLIEVGSTFFPLRPFPRQPLRRCRNAVKIVQRCEFNPGAEAKGPNMKHGGFPFRQHPTPSQSYLSEPWQISQGSGDTASP